LGAGSKNLKGYPLVWEIPPGPPKMRRGGVVRSSICGCHPLDFIFSDEGRDPGSKRCEKNSYLGIPGHGAISSFSGAVSKVKLRIFSAYIAGN